MDTRSDVRDHLIFNVGIVIVPQISSYSSGEYWTLVLCDAGLRAIGPVPFL